MLSQVRSKFLTLAVEEVYNFSAEETQVIQVDRVQPERFRLDGVRKYQRPRPRPRPRTHTRTRRRESLYLCSKLSLA